MWVLIGKKLCYRCNFVVLTELIEEDGKKKGTNGAVYVWVVIGLSKIGEREWYFFLWQETKQGSGMKKKTIINNQKTQTRQTTPLSVEETTLLQSYRSTPEREKEREF